MDNSPAADQGNIIYLSLYFTTNSANANANILTYEMSGSQQRFLKD